MYQKENSTYISLAESVHIIEQRTHSIVNEYLGDALRRHATHNLLLSFECDISGTEVICHFRCF